jgi:spermidine/putrescine transport system permease protein
MKKFLSVLIIALALIFVYAPIILLLIYSFTESKTIGVWSGFSINLYINLFEREKLITMITNTLVLAVLSALIATIIGTIGALGIFYNKKILGKLTKHASQIPIINAEIVTAISLALVFSFVSLGRTYLSLLIGHVVFCTPFVVLSIIPKLQQMDSSLYEAALDLGATPMQAFFKVILPEILPGIFSGFMLAITLSLDDYMITAYTKPPTFETISTYVYGALKKPKNSYLPELRALSSIIFIIMIIVVIIMNINASSKKQNENKKI